MEDHASVAISPAFCWIISFAGKYSAQNPDANRNTEGKMGTIAPAPPVELFGGKAETPMGTARTPAQQLCLRKLRCAQQETVAH